ncbi:hypothetical protein Tdes44962_MAKER09332 [Teratosphaeria destructans]|uniref:Uncharacterized protein n=1 Tax=Teratosphaeria destructans TaxID=418781 RepID=A0A9W7W3F6_9PEZI|nr:hypothetical protein Tdes44962_MAKER09332 [Teratosphaeria destructans]
MALWTVKTALQRRLRIDMAQLAAQFRHNEGGNFKRMIEWGIGSWAGADEVFMKIQKAAAPPYR